MAQINNPFETDEVVGIAPADRLTEIEGALQEAGFDLEVLRGPWDADAIEIDGDDIASKIVRFFQQGEEKDSLRKFKAHLADGDSVIRVIAVGDRAEEAGQIFADHDGHTVWHYGEWTYLKLHD